MKFNGFAFRNGILPCLRTSAATLAGETRNWYMSFTSVWKDATDPMEKSGPVLRLCRASDAANSNRPCPPQVQGEARGDMIVVPSDEIEDGVGGVMLLTGSAQDSSSKDLCLMPACHLTALSPAEILRRCRS